MTRTSFAALALAALFLLTALPSPPAQARNVEVCLMRGLINMEGNDNLGLDISDDGLWPRGGMWYPHAPWEGYADFHGSASFDGRCANASAGVGAFGVSTDPPENKGAEGDSNGDGVGDTWAATWEQLSNLVIEPLVDLDNDGLLNVREFQWELVPVCVPAFQNCLDHEADSSSGANGDGWTDGAEVTYWNNPNNDNVNLAALAFYDQDRLLDTDGDQDTNVNDKDSDNDGRLDGVEYATGSYPEFLDSDCDRQATACTASTATTYIATNRQGHPGAGDGIWDGDELAAWNALSASAATTNFDADGIALNLLDPDSDNDGLLDGPEFILGSPQVRPDLLDTEGDGVIDGDEVAWHEDTDLDSLVNANDPDSDNDGMPDKWEVDHHFNMVDFTDAVLDRDGDGLTNLGEYQHGTDPSDMDSEGTSIQQGDLLLDGEEVNVYHTNPLFWDSDADGMADYFEAQNNFNPLDPADAGQDADGDSFDQNLDGTPELVWTNLKEYRYGRAASYNEATQGPWLQGTNPLDRDSDKDGAQDGYEAYYGTNPTLPADGNADQDQDGLNFTQEVNYASNPTDPDTDNDGLCDGGRAANCFFPNLGSAPNQPGEVVDYGSIPWSTDADADQVSDHDEVLAWDPGATGTAQDVDGDKLNGVIDADSDEDGLKDGEEIAYQTDMRLSDSDQDQLTDGAEVYDHGTIPSDSDTDNDGLLDGPEVKVHLTLPTSWDTDSDGLSDGAEFSTHDTDPLLRDTDQDDLPDGWEVGKGTQPRADDANVDADADGLSNIREYALLTHPRQADTDGDGMPDGYEDSFNLNPTAATGSGDVDSDGLTNVNEFNKKTNPRMADTDADGLNDGPEVNTHATDPLMPDTDADGLNDGDELAAWNAKSYSLADADGDTLSALRDPDSDNDNLNDRDELIDTKTNPRVGDSDGDTLSDYDEVVTYGGQFNPNDADTDDDGQNDGIEASLLNPNGDTDKDGIKNGEESATYSTDPTQADSDCDGIQDGPELIYWAASWNSGGNRLLTADVDGDSLKDGVELGTVGTPSQALYRTRPDVADTDGDGLNDDQEAQNTVRVSCNAPQGASSQQSSAPLFGPAPPSSLPIVAGGMVFLKDNVGWYLRGGYGVHLYLVNVSIENFLVQQQASGPAPGKNGKLTHPSVADTDGDHLPDGHEVNTAGTNPTLCDSDGDGLGDALELGVPGQTLDTGNPCTHLDADTTTTTNPLNTNSDNDGTSLSDGVEDANRNGLADGLPTAASTAYCGTVGTETDPSDADSDDDGLLDGIELAGGPGLVPTNPFCFDTDKDGLSDGLEQGVTTMIAATLTAKGTAPRGVLGIGWPTWQQFEGEYNAAGPIVSPVNDPDWDDDGIPDGMEDLNHNGKWGFNGKSDGATYIAIHHDATGGVEELNPKDSDSDGDNMVDGRELLIFSPTSGNTMGMNFLQIMQTPGFSLAKLNYDAANKWVLNPRSGDTDNDGVKDGADLSPRADAFLALQFTQFRMVQTPDWNGWGVDLYFDDIKVALPIADTPFQLGMDEMAAVEFYSKHLTTLPDNLVRNTADAARSSTPSTLGTLGWFVDRVNGDVNAIKFDIPELSPPSADLKNLAITITIAAMDDDGFGDANDRIDLDPTRGSYAAVHTIKLGDDALGKVNPSAGLEGNGYLVYQNTPREYRGIEDTFNDEEGLLRVTAGDTLPTFFLQGLEKINQNGKSGLPDGNCQGQASCVHA